MTLSKEILMRFVDGELPPEEASRVEAEIANDAQARAFVEAQAALRHEFSAAFAPVMDEPVPEQIAAAMAHTPISRRWRLSRAFSAVEGPRIWIPTAGALALGLAIGILVNPGMTGPLATQRNGTVVAQGALAQALSTQLASDVRPADAPRIGISFRAKDGRTCRTFQTSGAAGIACRAGEQWDVAALAATQPESSGTYHMAASGMPDVIRNAATNMISGAPFDAAAERAARDRDWQE